MPPPPPPPGPRLLRPWRWAAGTYLVLLTIATHWPKLELGPSMPVADTSLHLWAFALLTVLVHRAGLVRSPWRAALLCFAWSIVDESTQAIPGLGRTVAGADLTANGLGCVMAAVWIHALGPVGGLPSRWRHGMLQATLDRVLRRPGIWIVAGASGIATLGTFLAVRTFALAPPAGLGLDEVDPVVFERWLVIGTAVVSAHVLALSTMVWWQRSMDRARAHGLCLACGRDQPEAAADLAPRSCTACGASIWSIAWLQSTPARPSLMASASLRPALAVMGFVVLAAVLLFITPLLMREAVGTPWQATSDALRGVFRRVPERLETPFDIVVFGTVLAMATRWTRRRLARSFDQPRHCRACGHDLRGSRTEGGVGRCAECGEAFVRDEGVGAT